LAKTRQSSKTETFLVKPRETTIEHPLRCEDLQTERPDKCIPSKFQEPASTLSGAVQENRSNKVNKKKQKTRKKKKKKKKKILWKAMTGLLKRISSSTPFTKQKIRAFHIHWDQANGSSESLFGFGLCTKCDTLATEVSSTARFFLMFFSISLAICESNGRYMEKNDLTANAGSRDVTTTKM
jgi:hypothetical protein